jgi:hypothetical protein
MFLLAMTYRPPRPRAVSLLAAALLLAGLAALALPGARPSGGPRAEEAAELAWDAEAQRRHAAYRAVNAQMKVTHLRSSESDPPGAFGRVRQFTYPLPSGCPRV